MRANRGIGRADESGLDDMAAVISTPGCFASSVNNSWPAYPVAPAIATRTVDEYVFIGSRKYTDHSTSIARILLFAVYNAYGL